MSRGGQIQISPLESTLRNRFLESQAARGAHSAAVRPNRARRSVLCASKSSATSTSAQERQPYTQEQDEQLRLSARESGDTECLPASSSQHSRRAWLIAASGSAGSVATRTQPAAAVDNRSTSSQPKRSEAVPQRAAKASEETGIVALRNPALNRCAGLAPLCR